jgi:ethanolamine permease
MHFQEMSTAADSYVVIEKNKPQEAKEDISIRKPTSTLRINKLDIWLFGFAIASGSRYHNWEAGVAPGMFSFPTAGVLIGFAYISYSLCISELMSALPFNGGAYGMTRCTLGFYAGFMLGCLEIIEFILYTSILVEFMTVLVCYEIPKFTDARPLVSALVYFPALIIQIRGGKIFWRNNLLLGGASVVLILIYIFGCIPYADFAKNGLENAEAQPLTSFSVMANSTDDNYYTKSTVQSFLAVLPFSSCFFIGLENMNLAAGLIENPRINLPKVQVTCVVALFAKMMATFFCAVSLPSGLDNLSHFRVPYTSGFMRIFNCKRELATLVGFPITYASAFGFMWSYGKLIEAMAHSRLLPSWLGELSVYQTPKHAFLAGSLISYGFAVLMGYSVTVKNHINFLCMLCALASYSIQAIAYLVVKKKYYRLDFAFVNKYGSLLALYALAIWLICFFSVVVYHAEELSGVSFLLIIMILTCIYLKYTKNTQKFSEAETKILMVLHIMKFNLSREEMKKKNSRQSSKQSSFNISKISQRSAKVIPVLNALNEMKNYSSPVSHSPTSNLPVDNGIPFVSHVMNTASGSD